MDPILEKVKVSAERSFALKEEILPHIKIGWHFHPEYELTLFTESTGQRFVGDNAAHFCPGDLLLIGPNLPHYMRNDPSYYERAGQRIRAIVVHFHPGFLGDGFFDSVELKAMKEMLHRSSRGLLFHEPNYLEMRPRMESLLQSKGYEQLRNLLDILDQLSRSSHDEELASVGFQNTFRKHDSDRIDRVYDYLLSHFQNEVSLSATAAMVNMNTSAFCKFFKKRTGQTFTQILNEIRIGHACKLLMREEISMAQICYQCGYSSQNYFNRKFRDIKAVSPGDYRKEFRRPA